MNRQESNPERTFHGAAPPAAPEPWPASPTERLVTDPSRLAFDIDGVVADTMNLFIRVAKEDHGLTIRYEDMTRYILEDCLDLPPELIMTIITKTIDGRRDHDLEPLPGAVEVLRRLADQASPVRFVTARPVADNITEWMIRILGLSPSRIDVVATGSFDKIPVLAEKGIRWFVDDRLETCFALKDAGIEPVVFRQPWNRTPHPFAEVGDWRELAGLIGVD